MRVLHVIEATIGGARRHVVDAVRGQAHAGVEVWLAAAARREPAFRTDLAALEGEGAHCLELPMVREIRPGRDLAHLRSLVALIARVRPDVVHTHSSKAGVLGRLASLEAGIGARVHTPHTFAFLFGSMFTPLRRALFRQIETALSGATRALVAVSPSEARTIRESGVAPGGLVRVVENGIDPRPWLSAPPTPRAALGVPPAVPLVAVVGLLNVAKGQDLALRALAEPGLEQVHLHNAGHRETREALEALASSLGLDGRAHFLGWRDDVPALVAACDALLLPSRWEGMPYIVLEAMAAARAVVAARVDGAVDLVEDGINGFLVPVEDPQALATALRRLLALSSAARAAMGAAGRQRVLERHSLERMLAGLQELYREVA